MLNAAKFPEWLHNGLWAHCSETATQLDNLMVTKEGEQCPTLQFYGELPKWATSLCTFGEIGIVANQRNKKIHGKLTDHGFPCIFVGYPEDHASDVYKMLNLATKKVIMSRNLIWLDKMYGEYKGIESI